MKKWQDIKNSSDSLLVLNEVLNAKTTDYGLKLIGKPKSFIESPCIFVYLLVLCKKV